VYIFLARVRVDGDVFAGSGLVGFRYRGDKIDGVQAYFYIEIVSGASVLGFEIRMDRRMIIGGGDWKPESCV
jgi:hypothetical protein